MNIVATSVTARIRDGVKLMTDCEPPFSDGWVTGLTSAQFVSRSSCVCCKSARVGSFFLVRLSTVEEQALVKKKLSEVKM